MQVRQEFNEIRDTLKRANIKVTHARVIIFKILKNASKELTAYDIEGESLVIDDRINLATIYSTLRLFQNMGLIQRYKVDVEQALYSLTRSEGAIRLSCNRCGSVQILNDPHIEHHIRNLCADKNLHANSYHLVVNVDACEQCARNLS